jgi:hypothetical protein
MPKMVKKAVDTFLKLPAASRLKLAALIRKVT